MIYINILVCGYGSIGKRHAKNIKSLGHDVIVVEPKEPNKTESSKLYRTYDTIDDAFNSEESIDIAVICSYTEQHITHAQACAMHDVKGIFVEKPLSHNKDGIITLKNICEEQNIKLMTGCNLLFSRGIQLIKTLLDNNSIGSPLSTQYYFGHGLKHWHPDTDYKTSYSAGEHGGILRDDSHAINLVQYLYGNIIQSTGILHRSGELDISNEDIASHIHVTDKNVVCTITSEYLNHQYIRNMFIAGQTGNLQWEISNISTDGNMECSVYIHTLTYEEWRVFDCSEHINDMYLNEIKYFINTVRNNRTPISDGIADVMVIDGLYINNLFNYTKMSENAKI